MLSSLCCLTAIIKPQLAKLLLLWFFTTLVLTPSFPVFSSSVQKMPYQITDPSSSASRLVLFMFTTWQFLVVYLIGKLCCSSIALSVEQKNRCTVCTASCETRWQLSPVKLFQLSLIYVLATYFIAHTDNFVVVSLLVVLKALWYFSVFVFVFLFKANHMFPFGLRFVVQFAL